MFFTFFQTCGRFRLRRYPSCSGWAAVHRELSSWASSVQRRWPSRRCENRRRRTLNTCENSSIPTSLASSKSAATFKDVIPSADEVQYVNMYLFFSQGCVHPGTVLLHHHGVLCTGSAIRGAEGGEESDPQASGGLGLGHCQRHELPTPAQDHPQRSQVS